jgi:hypothetical protein
MSGSFTTAGGSFISGMGAPAVVTPADGSTIGGNRPVLFINNGAVLAALTLQFGAAPSDGDVIAWASAAAVKKLDVVDHAGTSVAGAPTAMDAGVSYEMRYIAAAWRRWR